MQTVDNEYFKPVPGFKFLQVSNLGRVRSFRCASAARPFRTLAPGLSSNGYLTIEQADDVGGAPRTRYVHNLVAATFIGPKPAGQLVMHKNDVKTDNRAENVVYGSYGDNLRMAYANGRRYTGPNSNGSKLTVDDVLSMRAKYQDGATTKALAAEFNITAVSVLRVVKGVTFSWIGNDAAQTQTAIAA